MTVPPVACRARACGFFFLVTLLAAPPTLEAQFAPIGSLLGRVEDLSFYASVGGLLPYSASLAEEPLGLRQFGVELLFIVSSVTRTCPANESGRCARSNDPRRIVGVDTTYTLVDRSVTRGPSGADTVDTYDVAYRPRYAPGAPPMQTDTVWDFELGIGYGQLFGFEEAKGGLDLRGSVRELPAVTIYAGHRHRQFYVGIKSGFMELNEVQAFEESADGSLSVYKAKASSFLLGATLGTWFDVYDFSVLLEAVYSVRSFPSVNWSGPSLPATLPRKLSLSGWSISTGLQFPIG